MTQPFRFLQRATLRMRAPLGVAYAKTLRDFFAAIRPELKVVVVDAPTIGPLDLTTPSPTGVLLSVQAIKICAADVVIIDGADTASPVAVQLLEHFLREHRQGKATIVLTSTDADADAYE